MTAQVAIRNYAQALSQLSENQITEVLEEILNTSDIDERVRPLVLAFNARLMTRLRESGTWPRRRIDGG